MDEEDRRFYCRRVSQAGNRSPILVTREIFDASQLVVPPSVAQLPPLQNTQENDENLNEHGGSQIPTLQEQAAMVTVQQPVATTAVASTPKKRTTKRFAKRHFLSNAFMSSSS